MKTAPFRYLFEPIDAAGLIFFRFAFGISVIYLALMHVHYDWIEQYFVTPEFNFFYSWIGPVETLPAPWMYLLLVCLGLSGLLVVFGWFYRLAMAAICLILTYFLVAEPSYYQNHIYLFVLLSGLGTAVPLHCSNSVDYPADTTENRATVPRIWSWVLRFQIGVVYLYAAIAKTNGDWFHCQPIMAQLESQTNTPVLGPILDHPTVILAATFGVLLYEYLIVPALLYERTRLVAFASICVFHFMNASLWTLDVFPWFMIAATTLFLDPGWPRRVGLMNNSSGANPANHPNEFLHGDRYQPFIVVGVAVYCLFQLLIPFRHHLYEGYVGWNEFGRNFSWRMKLDGKVGTQPVFRVEQQESGETLLVKPQKHLTESQYIHLQRNPVFLHQYAQELAERYQEGDQTPEIYLHHDVAFNGRPKQPIIRPGTDLVKATLPMVSVPEWIESVRYSIPESSSCIKGST